MIEPRKSLDHPRISYTSSDRSDKDIIFARFVQPPAEPMVISNTDKLTIPKHIQSDQAS